MNRIVNQMRGIKNIDGEKLAKYVEYWWKRYLDRLESANTLDEIGDAYSDFYGAIVPVLRYEFDSITNDPDAARDYQDLIYEVVELVSREQVYAEWGLYY